MFIAKHVKKVYSMMMALVLVFTCLGSVALAGEDVFTYVPGGAEAAQETPTTPADTGSSAPAQQSPAGPATSTDSGSTFVVTDDSAGEAAVVVDGEQEGDYPVYRVSFYNLAGDLVGWADVQEGAHLLELDGYPYVEGLVFQYWYDITNEIPEPYEFGTPVLSEINLVPYYTLDDGQGDAMGTAVYTDEEMASLISQILGTGASEETPAGMTGEKIDEIIGEIVGGLTTEQETHTVDDALGANVNDLFGDVVDPGSGTTEEEEKITTLITDILAVGEGENTPEGTEADGLQDIQDGETPLSGPEAEPDPMVLVTCMFEGETIEVGTTVTLSAELINFPEDAQVSYQWQNNASGDFVDVEGANERSYTLVSDGVNSNCIWQVQTTY